MRDHMAGPLTKAELIGGSVCGTALAMASNFQQIGISHTTVAKSGFLTALYVIIVPVIGIFMKKKIHPIIWLSVAISVVGLYLLCLFGKGSLSFSYGDTLEIICALMFSVQIIFVDHYSPRCRGIILSCVQFTVCGIESLILMILFEHPDINGLLAALPSILYVGIFSSGIAYTLQIIGQKNMDPTVSSLIMCLESVISAISGWIILGQKMSPSEIAGACLMFASIVMSQILPAKIGARK
jgi:drug/metabolite transporter (DMT)-like permease